MSNLREKALIVNLSISEWNGRKFDRKVTQEVDDAHGTHKSGAFSKNLIDLSELNPIIKVRGELRSTHNTLTLPWGDNGDRLLPAKGYFKYIEKIKELEREFNDEVSRFLSNYENLKAAARRNLKTLFVDSDYPTEQQIKQRFGVTITYLPVPDSYDFRVDIASSTDVDELRKSIASEISDRHKAATGDLVERCKGMVKRIIDTLDQGNDKTFRNTMITNLEELLEIIPSMNYTEDPAIDKMVKTLDNIVVDPDHLRNDVDFRQDYLNKVKKINDLLF